MAKVQTVNVGALLHAESRAGECWHSDWVFDEKFPFLCFKRRVQAQLDYMFKVFPGGDLKGAIDILHIPSGTRVDFVVIHGAMTIRDEVYMRGSWGRFTHRNRDPLAAHFPQDNPTDSVIVLIRF